MSSVSSIDSVTKKMEKLDIDSSKSPQGEDQDIGSLACAQTRLDLRHPIEINELKNYGGMVFPNMPWSMESVQKIRELFEKAKPKMDFDKIFLCFAVPRALFPRNCNNGQRFNVDIVLYYRERGAGNERKELDDWISYTRLRSDISVKEEYDVKTMAQYKRSVVNKALAELGIDIKKKKSQTLEPAADPIKKKG